jgi:L-threonylcarbamoyladenylate synthase
VVSAGLKTVAVRMPSSEIARNLIVNAGTPIAAPSANISGRPSGTCLADIYDELADKMDYIIDGGRCEVGIESTVVKVDGKNVRILRPGKITKEQIEEIAGSVILDEHVFNVVKNNDVVLSPGMKYRHYAPKAPLYLIDGNANDALSYIVNKKQGRVAIICYPEDIDLFTQYLCDCDIYDFGSRLDEARQAYLLFSILRDTDKKQYDTIYAPLPEKSGVGLALYNRMIRAAAHQIITLGR